MLYDLSFLDVGKRWPPPSEEERLGRYEGSRQLYESDHDKVFGQWFRLIRENKQATLEIVLDFPRRLSNLWASLLVGEPPTYAPPKEKREDKQAKDALSNLVHRGLTTALRECVIDMSRFGDGLLKSRLDEEGPVIEAVSPEIWFPVVSRGDVRKIKHHVLAWTFEEEVGGFFSTTKQKYLYAEIHSPGQVEYRLHTVTEGGVIGMEASDEKKHEFFEDWKPSETHRAEGMLVVHVPNRRSTNRLHGYDDYKSIEGKVMAMEVRLAQHDRVNENHGDPAMAGPRVERDSNTPAGEKYFVIEDPDAPRPEYIQQEINVESIEQQLDRLEKWLYIDSETSPTAFGVSETGYAESGTSLSLRMQAEQEKSSDLRTFLDKGAKEAIHLATLLGGTEVEDADIGWKDGLPQDEKEQTEIETSRVDKRLTSRKRAIMRLYDMDEEEAEEEIKRIDEEASPATLGGVPQGSLDRSRQLLEGALGGQTPNGNPPTGEEG